MPFFLKIVYSRKGRHNMLKRGDVAVYGNHGVCQVKEVLVPPFLDGQSEKLYYMMSPATDRNGVLYVPVEGAEDKMRTVVSKKHAQELLAELDEMEEIEVSSGKRAEAQIVSVIKENKTDDMMRLVKGLHKARAQRAREGKKLASMNERHLVTAEKLLYSEMAFSLKKEVADVKKQVMQTLTSLPLYA